MSKQATQDEDLIILSEDTEGGNTLEDLTLDFAEESTDNEIISFWEEEVSIESEAPTETEEEIILSLDEDQPAMEITSEEVVEETTEEVAEVETEEKATQELDLSLDFSEDASSEEVETEAEVETNETSESLDLGGFDLIDTETDDTVSDWVTAAAGLASMNSILEETVAKLEARKEAISGERSWKTSKVADLKAEIKKLEEEVLILEAEVEGLDMEAEKINLNINRLQDMKLWGEDVAREHNAQRVKM